MKVSGRCHCGKIAYEAEVDPAKAQICHCPRLSDADGFGVRVAVPASPDRFRVIRGDPHIYMKIADSGSRRGHAFCRDCGAPVFRLPTDNNPNYSLRIGGLDQRAEFAAPAKQIWAKRRLQWVPAIGDIPEFASQG